MAAQLRSEGVDCVVDEYEPAPIQGWQKWMMDEIAAADFVLLICSQGYAEKLARHVEPGVGLGVAWEAAMVIQDLYQAGGYNTKYVPVVLSADALAFIPLLLKSTTFYDLGREDGYEKLYRRLTNQPEVLKPQLGSIRIMAPHPAAPKPASTCVPEDGVPDLIKELIQAGWSAEVLESRWPRPEQAYTNGSDSPDFREVAYEGGSLRGFFNSVKTEVVAIAFESSHPDYTAVVEMESSDVYRVYKAPPFVFVCRTDRLSEREYKHVTQSEHSLAEITDLLGEPSCSTNLHGVGDRLYAFISQGLVFAGWYGRLRLSRPKQEAEPLPLTYRQYFVSFQAEAENFCRSRSEHMAHLRQAVGEGKLSPGGTYRAGVFSGGVYWQNWVVITQQGKAEVRIHAPHFIDGYDWLDSERLYSLCRMSIQRFIPQVCSMSRLAY